MKSILITVSILFCAGIRVSEAQQTFVCGLGASTLHNEMCGLLGGQVSGVKSSTSATREVNLILDPVGLPPNFKVVECAGINNAVAFLYNGERYVVLDPSFIDQIGRASGESQWAMKAILAHEVGHHLSGHTLTASNDFAESRMNELQADFFAGFILQKLGATKEEATSFIRALPEVLDEFKSTHPNKEKRRKEVLKGFDAARGVLTEERLIGCEGNCRDGFGIYRWPGGTYYSGKWADGKLHGVGELSYSNGDEYSGYFSQGEFSGWGEYTFSNGHSFAGDWLNGKQHGEGILTTDEFIVFGNWVKGELSGDGNKTNLQGDIIECCNYSSGKLNGQGWRETADYKDEGPFVEDALEGFGSRKFASGDEYAGSFVQGLFHGFGGYTWASGDEYLGDWELGEMSGFGRFTWANGDEYSGNWESGAMNGYGILTRSSGFKKRYFVMSDGNIKRRAYRLFGMFF